MSFEDLSNLDPVPFKDVDSEEIQGFGAFAVREHNEEKGENLEFVKVINGFEQGRRVRLLEFEAVLPENGNQQS
ncbi:Cystatin [Cucumis melo var. makuwa]|uniref:Cystatin n=1 Tax=Cucumis melo var. makuwa TaxID=1194695 RepID=A0A5D3DF67_CUCMM|nr:Cystatin [Cucumis melo var. makuwa]TYK22030.1 Cystatin [Cucumis melo var. makuwa]